MTVEKGLIGAKPPNFCFWLFDLLGADPGDDFYDLFPGTGIVTKCWHNWQDQKTDKRIPLELGGVH